MVTGSLSRRAGGLFHSVRSLSQNLAEAGARVTVIGTRDPDTEADLPAWAPLVPVVLEPGRLPGLGGARGIAEAIEASRPDVVHQHGIWMALSLDTARWARTGATMISPRGMLDPWALRNSGWKKRIAWSAWEAQNLRRASRIHALAEAEAEAIRSVLPDVRVTTIPNGVRMPEAPSRSKNDSGLRELLFLGRLHPKKGLPDFLKQWAQLPQTLRSRWRITVAGPDERGHRAELEKLAARLDLTTNLTFTGPLSGAAKEEALQRADAFILPSHSEGLPMAVLEAWSFGLPVLMTTACNLPEGFSAGAALEISSGQDPSSLRRALERRDLFEIGRCGRDLVERRFAWQCIANRHLDEYRAMVADHSKGTGDACA
ncbi:glycosyltransferase [Tropicimonas aquimaris]|uniref:Glycosyltransferase n=1 Tax=Tropicimonas aquimaris TaxID=914152 RepID=A0ABW3IXP0_9RHOB